jgi:DNA uptake protein ComE-like DNA-binding protein
MWAVPDDARPGDEEEDEPTDEVPEPEESEESEDEAPEPEPEEEQEPVAELPEGERVSLAEAGFEDLRRVGMSVTQAKRVLRYRDERGLSTLAELEDVPGFPRSFFDELGSRLTD